MSITEQTGIAESQSETDEQADGDATETGSATDTGVIQVTDAATAKIGELLSQETDGEQLALRVAVRAGGCSGFSYDMYFDADQGEGDRIWNASDIVRIVVDKESTRMLQGATLDYSDGLQGAGFHIVNPNASKSCGCGNSFS